MTLTDKAPTQVPPGEIRERRRFSMSQIVSGTVLVLIGLLWLFERIGAIDVSVTAVLGMATVAVGVALMVLADRGAHVGLVVFGLVIASMALLTAAAPFEGFQGGLGDRTLVVSTIDDIAADYNLAMGTLTIDLRDLDDLEANTPLTASVGMGELVVKVPRGTPIEVEARLGAGQLEILGRVVDGVGIDESYADPGLEPGDDSLALRLDVFAGRVEVTDE